MGFSGTIKLADLNDFIAPSQACVLNLDGKAKQDTAATPAVGQVSLQPRTPAFHQAQPAAPDKPVKVSLHDCLACSGCVTSAETVLLEQQSVEELMARLTPSDGATPSGAVVVSISPQTRASLAALHNISPLAAFRKLCAFFKSLGAAAVFDLTTARDIALHQTALDLAARYRQHLTGAAPHSSPASSGPLPMLASSCPGWVCYAEKTHGDYILPHISRARSPQAVQGFLVKRLLPQRLGVDVGSLYHVTVMPCYDKKLEASRDDFAVHGSPEVDCVLTTIEVLQLLQERGVDLASMPELPADVLLPGEDNEGGQWGPPGGAGGYLEYAMRFVAKEVLGQPLPPGPLATRALRNADMREAVAGDALRCAAAYGFRNIQTTVRKVKRGVCEYQFVEVMACPGGCNGGGGQAPAPAGETAAALLARVEAAYNASVRPRDPLDNPAVHAAYATVEGGAAAAVWRTAYHRREKTVAAAVGDW